MKYILYTLLLTLSLMSCGTDSRHFKIDGRLLHLNQGEFYVYSPDGGKSGLDTIKVQAGRFTYETECDREMTLMIVFPNFTEQPVFASPGKSVDIKGDASHLKEMTVKGTKDNELMNGFREQIANASPMEAKKYARQFIEDHPESMVGGYLVRRYFIQSDTPDFATAHKLIATLLAKRPDNDNLRTLQRIVADRQSPQVGNPAPRFTAYDINGRAVSDAFLSTSPTTIVVAWASWNFSSLTTLRVANDMARNSDGRVYVLSICLDYDKSQCRKTLDINSISNVTTICDGKSVDGDVYNRLCLSNIPDDIVFRNGKIAAVSIPSNELRDITNK